MATNELIAKLNELSELRRMAEELNAEIEGVQDAIKAHMTEADTDTITAGAFRVTWKAVTSTRIDTAALQKSCPRFGRSMEKPRPRAVSASRWRNKRRRNCHITLRPCHPKHNHEQRGARSYSITRTAPQQ